MTPTGHRAQNRPQKLFAASAAQDGEAGVANQSRIQITDKPAKLETLLREMWAWTTQAGNGSTVHSEAKSFYDALLYRLAFLRSDGSFRAYQCAHCGHGPIVHTDCDDLRAHHGQPLEEGESINNACPRCDNFVKNVNSMQPWDGSYSHVQTVRP